MKQLTLRGIDAELERHLRETARLEGESLARAALRLMRRGAGLDNKPDHECALGTSLDGFFGSWTEHEAREFDEAVAIFEQIDDELWR